MGAIVSGLSSYKVQNNLSLTIFMTQSTVNIKFLPEKNLTQKQLCSIYNQFLLANCRKWKSFRSFFVCVCLFLTVTA